MEISPSLPEALGNPYNLQILYVKSDLTHMLGQGLFYFRDQTIQRVQRELKGMLQKPLLGGLTNPNVLELPDKFTEEIIEEPDLSDACTARKLQERYGFRLESKPFTARSETPTDLLKYVSALLARIKQTLYPELNSQPRSDTQDIDEQDTRNYIGCSVCSSIAVNKRIWHDVIAQLVTIIPPGKEPINIIRIIKRTIIQETWGALPQQDFGEIHEDIIAAFLWE